MEIYTTMAPEDYVEMSMALSVGRARLLRKQPLLRAGLCLAVFLALFLGALLFSPADTTGDILRMVVMAASLMGIVVALVYIITLLLVRRQVEGMKDELPGAFVVRLDEQGVSLGNLPEMTHAWADIARLVETEHLYVFATREGTGAFFRKEALPAADAGAFDALLSRCFQGKRLPWGAPKKP